MRIMVVGCESSGTRWLYHNVVLHPQVTKMTHFSIPWKDQNPTSKIINVLSEYDAVLFMVRDSSCTAASMTKGAGWWKLLDKNRKNPNCAQYKVYSQDPIENWKESADVIINELNRTNKMYEIISYESLIQFREHVLNKLFGHLGLDPTLYQFYDKNHQGLDKFLEWAGPGSLYANDGNKKYFLKDDI